MEAAVCMYEYLVEPGWFSFLIVFTRSFDSNMYELYGIFLFSFPVYTMAVGLRDKVVKRNHGTAFPDYFTHSAWNCACIRT